MPSLASFRTRVILPNAPLLQQNRSTSVRLLELSRLTVSPNPVTRLLFLLPKVLLIRALDTPVSSALLTIKALNPPPCVPETVAPHVTEQTYAEKESAFPKDERRRKVPRKILRASLLVLLRPEMTWVIRTNIRRLHAPRKRLQRVALFSKTCRTTRSLLLPTPLARCKPARPAIDPWKKKHPLGKAQFYANRCAQRA